MFAINMAILVLFHSLLILSLLVFAIWPRKKIVYCKWTDKLLQEKYIVNLNPMNQNDYTPKYAIFKKLKTCSVSTLYWYKTSKRKWETTIFTKHD